MRQTAARLAILGIVMLALSDVAPADEPVPLPKAKAEMPQVRPPRLDVGKGRIEMPLKRLIAIQQDGAPAAAPGAAAAPPRDLTKDKIEAPTRAIVDRTVRVPIPQSVDQRKVIIETPVKKIVAGAATVDQPVANPPAANQRGDLPPAPNAPPRVAPAPLRDLTKRKIERPVERLVEADAPLAKGAPAKDAPAKDAEPARSKTNEARDNRNDALGSAQLEEKVVTTPDADDNPHVEPGKVHWHDDFAAACTAAKKSGKPVMLFHLMGQLDQKFT